MRKFTTRKGVELLVPEKGERHPGAGRPKGSKNVISGMLKEAILRAAEESHFLTYIARDRPELFGRLLLRVLQAQREK